MEDDKSHPSSGNTNNNNVETNAAHSLTDVPQNNDCSSEMNEMPCCDLATPLHNADTLSQLSLPSLTDSPERPQNPSFTSHPSALAFAVLKRSTRKSLQLLLKLWNKPSYGLKESIVARCYLHLVHMEQDPIKRKAYEEFLATRRKVNAQLPEDEERPVHEIDFMRWMLTTSTGNDCFEDNYYILQRLKRWRLPPPIHEIKQSSAVKVAKGIPDSTSLSPRRKRDNVCISQVSGLNHAEMGGNYEKASKIRKAVVDTDDVLEHLDEGDQHVSGTLDKPSHRKTLTFDDDDIDNEGLEGTEAADYGTIVLGDDDKNGTRIRQIGLSLSEYGRLLVLIRDNDRVRSDLIKSRMTMTRSELDAKLSMDEFWKGELVQAFNSFDYEPKADLSAVSPSLDVSVPPLRARTSDQLKLLFLDSRSFFAKVWGIHSASGNLESSLERFTHDTLRTDGGYTQKGLSMSVKGKRALISYILMELNSPQKRKNNKLLQVFSKSLYQTMKDGSIVNVSAEGGCGEFDSVDVDLDNVGTPRSDKMSLPQHRSTRPKDCPSSTSPTNTSPQNANPELTSKFSSQRRSFDGARELANEMRNERDDWKRRQEIADERREKNQAEKERRRDQRVKMLCDSVSIQDATESASQLTSAERRILEVDTLSRSLRVKMTELTAAIRQARQDDDDDEIVEILVADLDRTKEQYRSLLGITSRGGDNMGPSNKPATEEGGACDAQ